MIVVITSIIADQSGLKVSFIRMLRMLKPLRTINKIPELKNLINTLVKSLKTTLIVLAFLLVIFMSFSIFGMVIFRGVYDFRCRESQAPINGGTSWPIDDDHPYLCAHNNDCGENTFCPTKGQLFSDISAFTTNHEEIYNFELHEQTIESNKKLPELQ